MKDVSKQNDDYEKYMGVLDIVLRTCATMLAIIFAYTLGSQSISFILQLWVTILVVFLTVTVLISGVSIILGRKTEPKTLKGLALFSFVMMVGLIICMLILLLLTIWR